MIEELEDADIQKAVERLLQSSEFVDSARLVGFLRYVVDQTLAGRAADIKAKTIGMDVYGYSVSEIDDRENVVRVDAGRIRRKLNEYYAGTGCLETIRVELPKGSYVPAFTRVAETQTPRVSAREHITVKPTGLILVGIALGVLVLGVIALVIRDTFQTDNAAVEVAGTSSASVFDVSPSRVEAENLARLGRDMIFPATDPGRLTASLAVFRSAIASDPDYFGGHAGAAQVLTLIAITSADDDAAARASEEAEAAGDRAISLAPGSAWAVSAHGMAAWARGDHDAALLLSSKAYGIDPGDVYVAEFDALLSLFTGHFDKVIERIEPFLVESSLYRGFVFHNALGSSYFHLGDFERSAEVLTDAINNRGPFGPAPYAYLMAAKYELGETQEARELARRFSETWPNSKITHLLAGIFVNQQYALDLEKAMTGAGWQSE